LTIILLFLTGIWEQTTKQGQTTPGKRQLTPSTNDSEMMAEESDSTSFIGDRFV
jgi:hypothetical protein